MKNACRILGLVALVLMGCGGNSGPHVTKFGGAPPPGRIVYSDPSISPGQSGAVGEVVYLSGGTASWVKTDTPNTSWSTFPGSAISSVTADAPLSGSGTSGSHLVLSAATANAAGSLAAADFAKLASAVTGGVIVAGMPSAQFDLVTPATINIPIPSAGTFHMTSLSIEILSTAGGPGTTTAAFDIHVNGGTFKAGAASLSVATLTAAGTTPFFRTLSNTGPIYNSSQALDIVIATAMGGYSSVPSKFWITGFYQ